MIFTKILQKMLKLDLISKGKNKKVIALMKDELGENTMTKLAGLRAKTYSYLIDDSCEDKKAQGKKECIKRN